MRKRKYKFSEEKRSIISNRIKEYDIQSARIYTKCIKSKMVRSKYRKLKLRWVIID